LLHKGQDPHQPGWLIATTIVAIPEARPGLIAGWRKNFKGVFECQCAQRNLVKIVLALHGSGSLASRLDCWQKEADENPSDDYHDQQLDESETKPY
jgi:hypothetical protein